MEEQNEDCSTVTRGYVFFNVTTRKCVVFFRNYGSHCVRSYGVAQYMGWKSEAIPRLLSPF